MIGVVVAIAPSYWQRTLFGFVALSVLAPALAIGLVALRRVVLDPWAQRRKWPEGAGLGGVARIPAEFIADVQRGVHLGPGGAGDFVDAMVALRVGAAFAALAVIPASTGLVVAQPGFGVFVLPVCVLVDSLALAAARRFRHARTASEQSGDEPNHGDGDGRSLNSAAVLVAAGCLFALSGAVVATQWGTTTMAGIVYSQAHSAVASVAGWGLPSAVAQAPAALVALLAAYLLAARLPGDPRAVPSATSQGTVDQVARALWLVAGAAWIAVCFGGGGDVPWKIANDGVRHVVSALLVLGKTTSIALAISWVAALRPTVTRHWVRRILATGALAMIGSIVVTAAVRAII